MLANDPPTSVRERTVPLGCDWGTLPAETIMLLLRQLVNDAAPRVGADAIRSLTAVVALAPPVERVELVYRWVLSSKADERAAIAAALCSPIPVLASDFAIEQLAQDAEPRVRALSGLAAACRFREAPGTYEKVLTRLVADPDRWVRRMADRLLKALGTT